MTLKPMSPEDVRELRNGLYFLVWTTGGGSVAAVYRDAAGVIWFCATNWVSGPTSDWWGSVARAELITTQRAELDRRLTAEERLV